MTDTIDRHDYGKISPTAKITAYWRSLSDIPYSKEIAVAVRAEETAREMLGDEIVATGGRLSPAIFEVRYKSIDDGLRRVGLTDVLELACGLSPRGLDIVSHGGTYVGTDLPDMHAESSAVLRDIAARDRIPTTSLHLQSANVLEMSELEDAAHHFNGRSFAICNEGLLPYLNMEEKKKMAENIRALLVKKGGCWITTDIVFKVFRQSVAQLFGRNSLDAVRPAMKNIIAQTGRNILANDFADIGAAEKFYRELGFNIAEYPMYTGDYELSTAGRLDDRIKDRFLEILASAKVWIMVPKP